MVGTMTINGVSYTIDNVTIGGKRLYEDPLPYRRPPPYFELAGDIEVIDDAAQQQLLQRLVAMTEERNTELLRQLLGLWVSECEPVIVWGDSGPIGLAAAHDIARIIVHAPEPKE